MDFWFLLKKSLSVYVHPLTIAMELIVTGVVLVGFSRRQRRKPPGKWGRWLRRVMGDFGVGLIITGIFFLFLCSIKPIADPLVYSLEKRYPPLPLAEMSESEIQAVAPEFIVVLAGGERYDPGKPPTSQLATEALARVIEGARLARIFPDASVVFTGQPDEVRAMTEAVIDLGVSKERILSESESRDTKDHPRLLRPIIGESRFFLVTSGTHMPRAMALFEAEGFEPVAAACDLWVWPRFGEQSPYQPENFIPKVECLMMTQTAFHEYLGMAWANLFEAEQDRGEVESAVASEPGPSDPVGAAPVPQEKPVPRAPLPLPEKTTNGKGDAGPGIGGETSAPSEPPPGDDHRPDPRKTDAPAPGPIEPAQPAPPSRAGSLFL